MWHSLCDCVWELKGFWPGEPLWTTSVESTVTRRGIMDWIPAQVPGGVHRALQKAGILPDPYFERNSLLCEWVENRWWCYRTVFTPPQSAAGKRLRLVFRGLDDTARVFLNGGLLGEHTGIYEPAVFDISAHMRMGEENSLLVLLEGAPREQGQIGCTSKTATQKARFNYKWDFCTRLVNIGIWQEAGLHASGTAYFSDVAVTSDVREGAGFLRIKAAACGMAGALKADVSLDGRLLLSRLFKAGSEVDPVFCGEIISVAANRRRKFQNAGSILWQFNEPYPNASCTSLTEYAGYPKHAYYAIRKAYAPLAVSLQYESLLVPADAPMAVSLSVHSTRACGTASLLLEALDIHGRILENFQTNVTLMENRCTPAGEQTLCLPPQPYGLFFLRLTLLMAKIPCARELYFFTQREEADAPLSPMLCLPRARVRLTPQDGSFLAHNTGNTVCLYLHGEPEDASSAMLQDSFVTLFPGESEMLVPMEKAGNWRFGALNDTDILFDAGRKHHAGN